MKKTFSEKVIEANPFEINKTTCKHCENFCKNGTTHVNYYSYNKTEISQGHIDPIKYCPHCGRSLK